MLKCIQVRNYRILEDVEIDGLSRVNLIAGRNSSGKTSLLEAIFLFSGAGNPQVAIDANLMRGLGLGGPAASSEALWGEFFSGLDSNRSIEISAHHATLGRLSLEIGWGVPGPIEVRLDSAGVPSTTNLRSPHALTFHYRGPGDSAPVEGFMRMKGEDIEYSKTPGDIPFPAVILSSGIGSLREDAVRLGQLRRQKRGGLLLDALRVVEPRLQSVEDSLASGEPMIMGDVGLSELIPLAVMGEGMTRLARLVLAISSSPGGVVLVDEVENGLHYSVVPKVWEVIGAAAAQFGVQVFATTHSLECIRAAHDSLDSEAFRYYRLQVYDSEVRCVTYEPEVMDASIRHNFEVR